MEKYRFWRMYQAKLLDVVGTTDSADEQRRALDMLKVIRDTIYRESMLETCRQLAALGEGRYALRAMAHAESVIAAQDR